MGEHDSSDSTLLQVVSLARKPTQMRLRSLKYSPARLSQAEFRVPVPILRLLRRRKMRKKRVFIPMTFEIYVALRHRHSPTPARMRLLDGIRLDPVMVSTLMAQSALPHIENRIVSLTCAYDVANRSSVLEMMRSRRRLDVHVRCVVSS